ncbi:MAG: DsbA family protein [Myxococcales bacterium]|nr:DsbA family protein [Myxococcales bacterium]
MSFTTKVKGVAIGAYLDAGPKVARLWHRARHALSADRVVTFWHQVDDPWSHLLAQALLPVLAEFPEVRLEPVLVPEPAADVDPEPQLRHAYALRDARRLAAAHGLSFPSTPVEPSADRLRRAQSVLLVEREPSAWLEAAVWVGEAVLGGDPDALATAVRELGTVPGQSVRPTLEESYRRLRRAGHFSGGVLTYDGEHHWGLDRLPRLISRWTEEGLFVEGTSSPSNATVKGSGTWPRGLHAAEAPSAPVAEPLPLDAQGRVGLDLYVSFRSPFSYLALERLGRLMERYPLAPRMRFVLPMVTRGLAVPRAKRVELTKDAKREADRLSIPFGRICDPLGEGVERALAIACALRRARGDAFAFAFARVVGEHVWSRATDLTTTAGLLSLTTEAGLDEAFVAAALADEAWRGEVEENRRALTDLGLWGVPSLDLGDETFWGQDRIPLLERRLEATF